MAVPLPEKGLLEEPKAGVRPQWDNKFQYLLSCVGFAVGLGNVWRFPYLCQTYGGGAFLIPYFIALIFEGIPLFHLELAIGQRLRRGIGSVIVSFLVSSYYNTILMWVMWYFLNSFQAPLPWGSCPLDDNRTGPVEECQDSTAVNYFWYRRTLNISPDINESGTLQWHLVMCSAVCWIIVYICTIRGIESTGKAIYFTALFPYLVLTIFLIRGLTLPGATEGLIYLFTPNMQILQNPRVWLDAATQIFFSLSLASGGFIAFSSYNQPKNDCEKDAVIITLINSVTSLYASIAVFSVLGFKATSGYWDCMDRNIISIINEFDFPEHSIQRHNYLDLLGHLNSTQPGRLAGLRLRSCRLQDFLDQSASGPGLAFIVFTEAINRMPGSLVWALLFFGMLFSLGLSSMFGNIEGVLTPLLDTHFLSRSVPKEVLSGVICLTCFLTALCFTLQSGSYWLEVFDKYGASISLLILAFFEFIGIAYVYGMKRFGDDLEWMTGRRPNLYWQVAWKFVSPLLMLIIFLAFLTLQTQKQPTYGAWDPDYENFPTKQEKMYPGWGQAICTLLPLCVCISIPSVALYHLINRWKGKRQTSGSNPYENRSYDTVGDRGSE
ncbi:inactive sodium-dependent neutral amino acid transporter B(0)AT3 isoform X2 [Ornithorhynchus anatinus]|uniref:inactive sodium-dependent neutral amino acid transporter B(0)AT3 isoform X2 n=1 Tax=Ornithorhynchus anatinus TaxID=9258 RepID=UPI0010A8E97E|nr:inactive sodium-dependent neutral amino acid transporter B(0)AT3 isoform X2 [Ornithorhynchus anatinus]